MSRTVVIFGGSYGGSRAAQVLAAGLPNGWRIVMVDKNSHCNHLYVLPRVAVLPGHEQKAFIPYTNAFHPGRKPTGHQDVGSNHLFIQAQITSISQNSFEFKRMGISPSASSQSLQTIESKNETMAFDFAIYALGAHLPAPVNVWTHEGESHGKEVGQGTISESGTKPEGVTWLQNSQARIKSARSVLLVGGGAMGIQLASDIKDVYPDKRVVLVHSRDRLLPIYKQEVHDEVVSTMHRLGVELILGERLDLETIRDIKFNKRQERVVRTLRGREISAELVFLCTGQTPNTTLIRELAPKAIDSSTQEISVLRTLQVTKAPLVGENWVAELENKVQTPDPGQSQSGQNLQSEPLLPHIFAIGDAASAFGAIKAGHTAYYQAEVAARNILRLIKRHETQHSGNVEQQDKFGAKTSKIGSQLEGEGRESAERLEEYNPGLPAIKVSLGLRHYVGQMNGVVGARDDGKDDLDALLMWQYFGVDPSDTSV